MKDAEDRINSILTQIENDTSIILTETQETTELLAKCRRLQSQLYDIFNEVCFLRYFSIIT